MARKKVVVIEDEKDILELIEYNLRREGYDVFAHTDGDRGVTLVREVAPELVLLDLMLPGQDGLEACRRLKADPLTQHIPIVMVTAKGEESEIVLGLGVGADDYVVKPFSPKELMARCRAVLRRGPLAEDKATGDRVINGPLVVDDARHEALLDGDRLQLTATEFRLLGFLARHPGRVFKRDQLLNRVIGENAFVHDRNIDVHVRSVRKKLGAHRELIETIRGVGYRFRDMKGTG